MAAVLVGKAVRDGNRSARTRTRFAVPLRQLNRLGFEPGLNALTQFLILSASALQKRGPLSRRECHRLDENRLFPII